MPFYIKDNGDGTGNLYYVSMDSSVTNVYRAPYSIWYIAPPELKQLDEKFIPDTIARKSTLSMSDITEAPTAEDFNNLLRLLRASGYLATE
jgi:hypothetical protein